MSEKVDERPGDDATLEDFEFYWELHGLEISYDVNRGNYEELRRLLEALERVDPAVTWRAENREVFEAQHKELNRLLHNFLASAYSLLQHTLRHVRHFYGATAFAAEYEADVNQRIAGAPVREFIQDLRVYIQHYKIPDVWATLSSDESGRHSTFELSVADLRRWPNWKPLSHDYMEAAGNHIRVTNAVDEYMRLIGELYDWLKCREEELNLEVIARVKQQTGRSNKA